MPRNSRGGVAPWVVVGRVCLRPVALRRKCSLTNMPLGNGMGRRCGFSISGSVTVPLSDPGSFLNRYISNSSLTCLMLRPWVLSLTRVSMPLTV